MGKGDERYRYDQIHLVFEQGRLLKMPDRDKPQVIVNFAALVYATSRKKSFRYHDTNIVAQAKMCEDLLKRDYLERFIQIGTSELYGPVDHPFPEDAPFRPTSPYAVSKLACDLHFETLLAVKKFPMNIIRPWSAYGPGQLLYRLPPLAVYAAQHGQKLPLQGGGTVKKSYMHAQDVSHAIWLMAEKALFGRTYNVGPERTCTIRHLVELVAEERSLLFDKIAEITPGRVGEDRQYWLDSTRIKTELGWRQRISLRKGVRDMAQWARRYLEQLPPPSDFVLRA